MSLSWSSDAGTRVTPQTERIPGRKAMVQNSAGGYGFSLDIWGRLDRFLILGTEGGTYYASERKLTKENAENILACLRADGMRAVQRIVEISKAGRAPKNDPAIFALAAACAAPNVGDSSDRATRAAAYAALPEVCRTGTHLFHFAQFVEMFRGWGRGLRRAVAQWYLSPTYDDLAYQLVKYKQRDGWAHRDLLRLAHPKAPDELRNRLFKWAVGKLEEGAELPEVITAATRLSGCTDEHEAAFLIAAHRLPREVVPTQLLNSPVVWEALLQDMPMTAMIRNLGKMSAVGLLAPFSNAVGVVASRLRDEDTLHKSRVHPIQVLSALKVYGQGHGERGSLSWTPVGEVTATLDQAFYLAFGNVRPSGKRMLLALDVSGSMDGGVIAGVPGLTPRVASAAMALVTARVEPHTQIIGFADKGLVRLHLDSRVGLESAIAQMQQIPFGGTDCSIPMVAAMRNSWDVDAFVLYTDSETFAGNIHPSQALKNYRERKGINAKSVVVGMTSSGFTIADPEDAGMLDVVGFDTATPDLISTFCGEGEKP